MLKCLISKWKITSKISIHLDIRCRMEIVQGENKALRDGNQWTKNAQRTEKESSQMRRTGNIMKRFKILVGIKTESDKWVFALMCWN